MSASFPFLVVYNGVRLELNPLFILRTTSQKCAKSFQLQTCHEETADCSFLRFETRGHERNSFGWNAHPHIHRSSVPQRCTLAKTRLNANRPDRVLTAVIWHYPRNNDVLHINTNFWDLFHSGKSTVFTPGVLSVVGLSKSAIIIGCPSSFVLLSGLRDVPSLPSPTEPHEHLRIK